MSDPYDAHRAALDPLDDLRARFVYKQDTGDRWAILRAAKGPLLGDCEDFALTALWLICGRSEWRMAWWIATFRACLWHTTIDGDGHMMLWVRGRGWIDVRNPQFGPRKYRKKFPYLLPAYVVAMLVKG
jgi:hypothetical protein